jgi:predicted O-methyltransferase YrrM
MIRDAFTKPFSEIIVHPASGTGLFDFLAPLVPGLPSVPAELRDAPLPDDLGAQYVESSEPDVSRTLYTLARLLYARRIAEVGVFRGATTRFLSRALADNGGGELHLVDLSGEALARARAAAGELANVTLQSHPGSSYAPEVLSQVPSDLDLVYLDADHSEQGVRAELAAWIPKVRAGGIIAIHDAIHLTGVCKAAHEHAGTQATLTVSTGRGSGLAMIRIS